MTWYWGQVSGNILAMPLEFALGAVAGFVLRRPLGRLAARLQREALAEARAARQIAADLFEHHTGQVHDLAPGRESEEG